MTLPPAFFIGVDLGQKHDFTAISVIERRDGGPPNFLTPYIVPLTTYDLRQLERIPLGTPYPKVVDHIVRLTNLPELSGRSTLTVDATGVGAPVIDLLRDAPLHCHLIPLTITGAEHPRRATVPKRDLISTLEVMLENNELRIAANLPERRRLVEELMSLNSQTLSAPGQHHDDLVLSLALACYTARKSPIGHQINRLL